jgi:hypothetical protein
MAQLASIVATLAVGGAIASWITGAWLYARTLRTLTAHGEQSSTSWLAVAAWPFTRSRLEGAPAAEAANVNKALVGFLACLTVAAAATSVATNLARISR